MKNILFIVKFLPYPLCSGGRQAIANGLLSSKDDYNIILTYPQTEEEEISRAKDRQALLTLLGKKAKIVPYTNSDSTPVIPTWKRLLSKKIEGLARRIYKKNQVINPFGYWVNELLPLPKPYIEHIHHLIETYHIDIVQCEMLYNLAIIHSLPTSVKTVFVHHELGFVRHALESAETESHLYDRNSYAGASKALEVSQLNLFDCVVTLSQTDTQKLQEAGVKTQIFTSFAIVSQEQPSIVQSDNPHHLTFIGSDNHEPNYLGIKWFLENCWDTLLKQDSNYLLTIVGKWNQQNIAKFSSRYSQVYFAGYVENMADAISGSTMIVPITVGSGIRMKILEAANLRIPFISTSIGAEGLPLEHNVHGLISDTPTGFVDAILQSRDLSLRKFLTENAYHVVEQRYSLSALRKNHHALYDSLYAQ